MQIVPSSGVVQQSRLPLVPIASSLNRQLVPIAHTLPLDPVLIPRHIATHQLPQLIDRAQCMTQQSRRTARQHRDARVRNLIALQQTQRALQDAQLQTLDNSKYLILDAPRAAFDCIEFNRSTNATLHRLASQQNARAEEALRLSTLREAKCRSALQSRREDEERRLFHPQREVIATRSRQLACKKAEASAAKSHLEQQLEKLRSVSSASTGRRENLAEQVAQLLSQRESRRQQRHLMAQQRQAAGGHRLFKPRRDTPHLSAIH